MPNAGIMASAVSAGISPAVLVNNDPCDNFTFAPWTTAGTPTVVAGGKTGNGFNVPQGTTHFVIYDIPAAAQTNSLTVGFWFKTAGLPTTPRTICSHRSDAGATSHTDLRVGTPGNMLLYNSSGSPVLVSSSNSAIVVGTWYYVEYQTRLGDSPNGSAAVRIGGTNIGSPATIGDTRNGGTKTVYDQFRFHGMGTGGAAFQVDDVYIRNDLTFGTS